MTRNKNGFDIETQIDAVRKNVQEGLPPEAFNRYLEAGVQVKQYEAAREISSNVAEVAKAGVSALQEYFSLQKAREETRQVERNIALETKKHDTDLAKAKMEHEKAMKGMEAAEKRGACTIDMLEKLNGLMEIEIDADNEDSFENAMRVADQFQKIHKDAR